MSDKASVSQALHTVPHSTRATEETQTTTRVTIATTQPSANSEETTKNQSEETQNSSINSQSEETENSASNSQPNSIEPEPSKPEHSKSVRFKRKSFLEMLGFVALAFGICLQYTVCSRLLNVKDTPRVGGKWTARHLPLPEEPYFTNIKTGDIALLEQMIWQHDMSVVVYYAPWSRASHRVLENMSNLSITIRDVKFIAINCWLYHSLCRNNFNSWDYPQVMIYHRIIDHIPYVFGLSTFPASFREQIERFLNPVLYVSSVEQLTTLLVSHQRSVIALFSSLDNNSEFIEFGKAALIHHLEYIDTYYVPFIVLDTEHAAVLDREEFNNLIYKHVLFQPLSRYETPSGKLRHRDLLAWLRDTSLPIHYLSHHKFSSLISNNMSVIFAGPLYRSSDNFISFMRGVMSYRTCPVVPTLKIHCKPNRTCMNPCLPDNSLTTNTILPCFTSSLPPPHSIQQCFYRGRLFGSRDHANQRTGNMDSSKMSEDFTQRTYLESDVMCSESREREAACSQCNRLEELQTELDAAVSLSTQPLLAPFHGEGCTTSTTTSTTRHQPVFYTLDTVTWADMLTRFGLNNTQKSATEALIKIEGSRERVHTCDLTNQTLGLEKFESFIWGGDQINEQYLDNQSAEHSEGDATREGDVTREREYIRDITRDELLQIQRDNTKRGNHYLIVVYTRWCGYCHVLQRKVEVAARLLHNTPLVFLAIDSDANRLSDTIVGTGSVPRLFLLARDTTVHLFTPRDPHKAVSVREIVHFIQGCVPESRFSDSSGPGFPVFPALPCRTWFPKPAPPAPPQPAPNLGLSDTTLHHILHTEEQLLANIKQEKQSKQQYGSCPIKHHVLIPGNPLLIPGNLPNQPHTPVLKPDTKPDNLPNRILDARLSFHTNSAVLESRLSTCRASRHLFKALAVSSEIDPQSLLPVTLTLFTDLYRYQCLGEPLADDMWGYVTPTCSRGTQDSVACMYLMAANVIVNSYSITPPRVLKLLAGKQHVKTRVVTTTTRVSYYDFNLRQCYNVRVELGYYLKRTCFYLCGLQCRIINSLL